MPAGSLWLAEALAERGFSCPERLISAIGMEWIFVRTRFQDERKVRTSAHLGGSDQ
jgi:hypothetical protein